MRARCRLVAAAAVAGLVCAPPPAARASAPAGEFAAPDPALGQGIRVADRGGRHGGGWGAGGGRDLPSLWRSQLERARREALREIEESESPPPARRDPSPRATRPPLDTGEASTPAPAEDESRETPTEATGAGAAPDAQPSPSSAEAAPAASAPALADAATPATPSPGVSSRGARAALAVALVAGAAALVAAGAWRRRLRTASRPLAAHLATGAPATAAGAAASGGVPAAPAGARDAPAHPAGPAVEEAVAAALGAAPAAAFPAGGRYEILEEIGRGGMGVVYKARDKRLDRHVALKRLPADLRDDARFVEMLLREARSTARLNHPNIVTLYDVDAEEGAYFLTMELLQGRPLAAILRERGRLTPRSAVWAAEQAVAGLGYAHAQGIVHRDVKPANLFLTRDRTLKLMDFGVAKILAEVRRKRTIIGGTPAYMAPEQAAGRALDGRADLYALGGTLFELLTGTVPFAEGDPLHHHQHTEAPDPRDRVANVPDELAALVRELMAKDPGARPASAALVATRLRAIAASLTA